MADQIQSSNSMESKSSEHLSLEERFGITEDDFGHEINEQKEVVHSFEKSSSEKDTSYQTILSKVKTQKEDHDEKTVMQDASDLHKEVDRESQITNLIDLAMSKGVAHAVKVAQKAEDYYVLDQLHDRLLSDELHDSLMTRGLIE
ncbi:MAG: hypothetical protein ACKUBY_01695 [Candidatus Moraniibacteriota bacterium]|jgi:hypothetical protein